MGPKSGGAEGAEKVFDEVNSIKDFDYIQTGNQAKIADKQQLREQ